MPTPVNNQTFNVDQSNGLNDGDANINGVVLNQKGDFHLATVDQSIDSGYNDQSNDATVVSTGLYWIGGNNTALFTIDQSNQLNDSDTNTATSEFGQTGDGHFADITQYIDSGSNSQSNFATLSNAHFVRDDHADSSATFDVTQFNGMSDMDTNKAMAAIHQTGDYNVGGVAQAVFTGGNTQTNDLSIDNDTGVHWYGAGADITNTFVTSQSNNLFDNDRTMTAASIVQNGTEGEGNYGYVSQVTDTGLNAQANSLDIARLGTSSFGTDTNQFDVDQFNGMRDEDVTNSQAAIKQVGYGNSADLSQWIDSGANSQSNEASITDMGGSREDYAPMKDVFKIDQSNQMMDNDQNANLAAVTQQGSAHETLVNQTISSGFNTQTNTLDVFDLNGGLHKNSDTYNITQANFLSDNDMNVNSTTVTQMTLADFAGISQDIFSGDNTSHNNFQVINDV